MLNNPRVLQLHDVKHLRAELTKIGADSSLPRDVATLLVFKLENILPKLARFVYQEMMLEGGQVILPAKMDDRSLAPVSVLMLGTAIQFRHLSVRLRTQNTDELNFLAGAIEHELD